MTGWTLFFTIAGVFFMTAQLFRLIDAIERPRHAHPVEDRRNAVAWRLSELRRVFPWMFWKS